MNIIVTGIVACEIGFWVVLGLGFVTRYLLKRLRLSTGLLLCVPLLDVLLLALIARDLLANGSTADFAHGLGAVYLGFTVAFRHQIITRVDAWFAHRFADGPTSVKPPKSGLPHVKHEWRQQLHMVACAVIASSALGGIVLLVNDPSRTEELTSWFARVWLATAVWLIGWPVWVSMNYAVKPTGQRTER